MATFLTGKALEENIYDIIFNAKSKLLIISPFIKLDGYFKEKVFNKHIKNADLHLIIAFGKNSKNPERSFNMEDFDYFKQFPNISIVYVPNLHAKYYANESVGIVTSINLYDYSFKNNIEFGVMSNTSLLGVGLDKIDEHAWEESMKILGQASAVFIRRPNFKKKLFGKDYLGSETKCDFTNELVKNVDFKKINVFNYMDTEYVNTPEINERESRSNYEKVDSSSTKTTLEVPKPITTPAKTISISKLSEQIGIPTSTLSRHFILKGLITPDEITELGKKKGLVVKNFKGKDYIAYPENLEELKDLK